MTRDNALTPQQQSFGSQGAVSPNETQFLAETATSSEQLPWPIAVRWVGRSDQDGQCEFHRPATA